MDADARARELGPVAMQTLLHVRYTLAGEPYIARGCRRKVARQLAMREPPLLTIEPIDRGEAEEWLRCSLTPDGQAVVEAIHTLLRSKTT